MYQINLNKGDSASQNSTIIESSIAVDRTIPDGFLGISPGRWPLVTTTDLLPLTGTFAVSGSAITGTNTKFKTELAVGSALYNAAGKLIGSVGSIFSDTSATLVALMFGAQATEEAGSTTSSPVFDFTYSTVRSMDSQITANQWDTVMDFQWRNMQFKVASISRVGTTVTVVLDSTYSQPYWFNVGGAVQITGVTEAGFNGTFAIASKIDGNTFTYPSGTSGTTTGTTTGIMTCIHFEHFDKWVNTHAAVGSKIIYTLFGTPQWATDTPTAVNAGYPGYPGGTSPINLTAGYPGLITFVGAMWARYGAKIKYWEIWNEPQFKADGTSSSFFYTGTVDQLMPLCRLVKQILAANSASALVKVIGPATWSAGDSVSQKLMMEASGGSNYAINATTFPASVVLTTSAASTASNILTFASAASVLAAHIGLSVLEKYPGANRLIPLGTKITAASATTITLSNAVTIPSGTAVSIGIGADYIDLFGVHTYHKQYTGDIFTQIANLRAYLTSLGLSTMPIIATEVGYLEAKGTETDQEYIDNITGLIAESVLAGCDLVCYYSWTHGTMGFSTRPAVAKNISRIWLALNGRYFNTALLRPALKTLTVT